MTATDRNEEINQFFLEKVRSIIEEFGLTFGDFEQEQHLTSFVAKSLRAMLLDEPDPNYPLSDDDGAGLSAQNERWLTAGELAAYLKRYPADFPVSALKPNGNDWLNVIGASNPADSDELSIILYTRDDFDTRQF